MYTIGNSDDLANVVKALKGVLIQIVPLECTSETSGKWLDVLDLAHAIVRQQVYPDLFLVCARDSVILAQALQGLAHQWKRFYGKIIIVESGVDSEHALLKRLPGGRLVGGVADNLRFVAGNWPRHYLNESRTLLLRSGGRLQTLKPDFVRYGLQRAQIVNMGSSDFNEVIAQFFDI